MLDNRDMIDGIVVRREALASVEAAEAADLLAYVDRAREAGELTYGEAHGRRRVDAAVHELSLAMRLPVPTVERQIARARRLRTLLPAVWEAWHAGRISTANVEAIDRAARRLTDPTSVACWMTLPSTGSLASPQVRRFVRWTGGSNTPNPALPPHATNSPVPIATSPCAQPVTG